NRPKIEGKIAVGDIIDPETGEVYLESGEKISKELLDKVSTTSIKEMTVMPEPKDPLILASIREDQPPAHEDMMTHEKALLKIYARLRPGTPPQLEKAKELFREKFQDPNRYRLGKVGRFRINRKFNQEIPETEMTLRSLDLLNSIRYILQLRGGEG